MTQGLSRDLSAPPPDLPRPGDFDAGLDRAEVIARGAALEDGRPFPLTIDVLLEDFRALMEAAAAQGLEARELVARAVHRLAAQGQRQMVAETVWT
jgi:hypothetical protein